MRKSMDDRKCEWPKMLYIAMREVSDISLASVQMCAINSYHDQDYWPTAPKIDAYEPKIDAYWIRT